MPGGLIIKKKNNIWRPVKTNAPPPTYFTMNFEGMNDVATWNGGLGPDYISEFYNGGYSTTGDGLGLPSAGPGPNYGVTFSADCHNLIDADDNGSGNIANEPSPNSAMFFFGTHPYFNIPAGFTVGLSFLYSTTVQGTVTAYSGVDRTGAVLGSVNIEVNAFAGCTGDPTGQYCNWDRLGISFLGVCRSVELGGQENFTVYDDITLGTNNVP